jgi:hypothetical protein
MHAHDITRSFQFTFEKTADEIRAKATPKVEAIKAKIEERIGRIRRIRDENGITDAIYIDLIQQYHNAQRTAAAAMMQNYSSTTRSNQTGRDETVTVGAGTLMYLVTEQGHIDGEREQVEQLELMIRNLADLQRLTSNGTPYVQKFVLRYDELKFLGF